MTTKIENEVIETILHRYDFYGKVTEQKTYIHAIEENGWMKLIFCVTLEDGRLLVIKLLHEDDDPTAEMRKVENQSIFSEQMRASGIRTPKRHQADGRYCTAFTYHDRPCVVTAEDWCGEEITVITTDIACEIGKLMARMHRISLEHSCVIGHRTLFSAAYWTV